MLDRCVAFGEYGTLTVWPFTRQLASSATRPAGPLKAIGWAASSARARASTASTLATPSTASLTPRWRPILPLTYARRMSAYLDQSGEPSDAPGRFVRLAGLEPLRLVAGMDFRPVATDSVMVNHVT